MRSSKRKPKDAFGDYAGAGLCGRDGDGVFVTPQGLLINELAPRVHNSGPGHKTVPASASLSCICGRLPSAVTATSGE